MTKIAPLAVLAAVVCLSVSACGLPEDPYGKPEAPDRASSLHPPMKWGNWKVVGKIKVGKGIYDDFLPEFDVKNLKHENDEGSFDVTFLKDGKVIGSAWCRTTPALNDDGLKPGEVGPVACDQGTTFKEGWTEIRIKDSF